MRGLPFVVVLHEGVKAIPLVRPYLSHLKRSLWLNGAFGFQKFIVLLQPFDVRASCRKLRVEVTTPFSFIKGGMFS